MNAELQPLDEIRRHTYEYLMANKDAEPNCQWLAKIIASWMNGESVLPNYLGLEPEQFQLLLATYFPKLNIPHNAPSGRELDYSRMLEKEDLIKLLQGFSIKKDQKSEWIISLIVSACLGSDHLWRDLGFWQRSELSEFLAYNFPDLAKRNDKDMKWKKFIYKQLCEAEGLNLCRAPSCEVCADHSVCFGPEE